MHLRERGHIGQAAELAKVSRTTVYAYRRDDPIFAAAWEKAIEDAAFTLEDEAWRRARDGVNEPIMYRDMVIGTQKRYSDTLLIFLLKHIKPDKFGDNLTIRLTAEAAAALSKHGLSASVLIEQYIQELALAESDE